MVRKHKRSLWPILVFILVTLISPRSEAEPDFLSHYKQGVSAIDSERWGHALESMDRAIRGRSDEARRLVRYAYVKPYIPHFYRGLALFKLGNCSGALDAWSTSERQGVVTRLSQFNEQIELARELCRTRRQSSARTSTPPPPRRSEPATPTPSPPQRQVTAPSSHRPVERRSAEALAPHQRTPTSRPAAPESGLSERWPRAQSPAAPTRPNGPPPAELLNAARHCLEGSYRDALALLSEADWPEDSYEKAFGHLLIGVAEMGLYLEGGERDSERLEVARRHVLETRRLLPDLEPSERFLSPRFLDFYYGQRPEGER